MLELNELLDVFNAGDALVMDEEALDACNFYSIEAQKIELDDLREKARSFGMRNTTLEKVERKVDKCIQKLDELKEKNKVYKDARKEAKKIDEECATKKKEKDELEKRIKHLQEREKKILDRITEVDTQKETEMQAFVEELKTVQDQKEETDAKTAELQSQTAALVQNENTIRAQQAKSREMYDSLVAEAQQTVNRTAENVDMYYFAVTDAVRGADF